MYEFVTTTRLVIFNLFEHLFDARGVASHRRVVVPAGSVYDAPGASVKPRERRRRAWRLAITGRRTLAFLVMPDGSSRLVVHPRTESQTGDRRSTRGHLI